MTFPFQPTDSSHNPINNYTGTISVTMEDESGNTYRHDAKFVDGEVVSCGSGHAVKPQIPQ